MLSIFARRVESMREASGSYEKKLAVYRHWSIGRTRRLAGGATSKLPARSA